MIEVDPATGLPREFVDRLRELLGDRADATLAALADGTRPGVWSNPLRSSDSPTDLLSSIGIRGEPCVWQPEAATLDPADKPAVTTSPPVLDGRLYPQGLSSMLAPRVLDPRPGESVLDLAAAPGGKTLHLAARMRLDGELAAVEPVRDRFFVLKENLQRGGAGEFVRTFSHDGRDVGRKTPGRFDAVMLDAPCSSEARFDPRRPETFAFWGPRKLAESARKQKALLRSAFDATKPGGRILYGTCAFAPEENELVVAHTLKRLAEAVRVEPIELPIDSTAGATEWRGKRLPEEVGLSRRILPDGTHTGFFMALLRRVR